MKSFKNIISLFVLASFVFLIPLKTNALTIEEVIKNLNDLQPSNISNIKDAINYYDYQGSIDEISSILDESLNSSKQANNKLDELNALMNSINDKNKDLLAIKDKKEYDSALDTLKEEVELAKKINNSAKTSSQEGLDKYNEALEKYANLKSELEDKKAKTEEILNANIMATNAKLDVINGLLEELVKHEDKLKDAFNEANDAYNNAKESATVANANFSEKLDVLKEYVEVNAESELNDLIEANTKYITSGILYASSQIALKLIDIEIDLVESEIESLKGELVLLDQELEPYKKAITDIENELSILEQIKVEKNELEKLEKSKIEQDNCAEYIPELNAATTVEKIIELLLENDSAFDFRDKEITIKIIKNIINENIGYIIVTSDSEKFVYSYVQNPETKEVTIYSQINVNASSISNLSTEFATGEYSALFNDNMYKIANLDIKIWSINGFNVDIINNYEVIIENNKWVAVEKKLDISWSGIKLVDGTKSDINVYKQGDSIVTSVSAVNKCDAITNNTIDTEIQNQKNKIDNLENQLNFTVTDVESSISNKTSERDAAKDEYNNKKATITNEDGLTYADIEAKIDELENELDSISLDGLTDIASLKNIINSAKEGNIDIKSILESINNLNIGLNHKRTLVELLDKILEENYNNAKEELKSVVGEDIDNISNILKEIAPLITEVAESNLNLLEEKVKYELAKANYDAYLEAKKIILDEKENTLKDLEELEKLQDENNFDLNDLESKIKEAESSLVNINNDLEVTINDYVEVKEENAESVDKTTTENTDVTDETGTSNKNTLSKEEKVEINDTTEETYEEELENGFNWLNLLWLLPIALIVFFIIFFIKRRKEEE